jgi:hypothetical protein
MVVVFLTPLAVGFYLASRWLTQAGFIVLFAFRKCEGAGDHFRPKTVPDTFAFPP